MVFAPSSLILTNYYLPLSGALGFMSVNMDINTIHLEKNIERFHKASISLAEKASGVMESDLKFFPIIIGKSPKFMGITSPNGKRDPEYFTPFIVNASFTLEMLIKAIIFYEGNGWQTGHDLIALYQMISTKSKKKANTLLKKYFSDNQYYKGVLEQINKEFDLKIKFNMADILHASSSAFESWRYAFDNQKTNSSFIGYGEAYLALSKVKNAILENKT
ncbi:hypothetical protein [Cognaticolwellia mytili]|uniref:hypothetical protein n=1 Tax=Cognaticolwellia mytili TaxID=1888913 RepID=UPI00118035CE|nr:hypothetical protein [Cognaticolwellia mytili]